MTTDRAWQRESAALAGRAEVRVGGATRRGHLGGGAGDSPVLAVDGGGASVFTFQGRIELDP